MVSGEALAIDLHDVAKTYRRRVQALRGVTMQVHRGEIFGLLGANGAGKTTLVKIMMTIVRPTRAHGTLLGRNIGHKPTLQMVGYLPEHHRFPPYLRAGDALDYYAALAKVPRRQRPARIAAVLDLVGMSQHAREKIGIFSKGMMQRIGLAQAMLNQPDLIVLDEPTDGVDPIGRRDIRNVLTQLKAAGKTVFLNSHLLGEVEMICDRVAILHQGQVIRQGRIEELTRDGQYYEIDLQIDARQACDAVQAALACTLEPRKAGPPSPLAGGPRTAPVLVGRLDDGRTVELACTCIRLAGNDAAAVQGVIDALRRRGLVIRSVQPTRPSLEDYFIQTVLAQGNAGAGGPAGAAPPPPPVHAAAGEVLT